MKLGKDQLVLTKRWHKGHNRWYKRLWLSCQTSHTALAGLIYRGAGGLSRAQTVQVLANSLALEIVVLCMQYSVSSEVLEINLVTTFMASLFAALVCIPSMTIFAAAFNPQIVVNLLKVVATCAGKAWRSRKAILYGLCCCPCKAWGQAVQLVNARAAHTAVRARWRKARRRLKLFAGMATPVATPAPHQMERDCDVESTSPPTAPAKNTSIMKVRPLGPPLSCLYVLPFLRPSLPLFPLLPILLPPSGRIWWPRYKPASPRPVYRSTGRPSRRSARNSCSKSIAKATWQGTRRPTLPLGCARESSSTLRSTSICSCSRSRARCALRR